MLFLDSSYKDPFLYVFVDKRVLLAYALEGITWPLRWLWSKEKQRKMEMRCLFAEDVSEEDGITPAVLWRM